MPADPFPAPSENLLGRVAARVAHDLNNAISIMSGHLYLVRNQAELPEEAAAAMEKAVLQIERLSRGLDRLASIGQSEPEMFEWNALVEEAAADPIHHAGPIEVDLDHGLRLFRGRRADIRRALDCLLRNAREASAPEAPVRIVTRALPDGPVLLAVEDAGTGIPPELSARVFQPFFTTREERGRGIGLTIVELVAAAHGATCDFEPGPQGGTRFRLCFPQNS